MGNFIKSMTTTHTTSMPITTINNDDKQNVLVFSYQDDEKLQKYAIPMNQVTQEMKELMNKFTIYGNDLVLQCFSMAGCIENGKPISWPQWRVHGIELPKDIFDNYVKLKKLIKTNSFCISGDEINENNENNENNEKIIVEQRLTIKMYFCFASDSINCSTKNSLVWE